MNRKNRTEAVLELEKIQHKVQTRYSRSFTAVYGIWVVFGQGMGGQMAQEKEGGKKGTNSDSNSSAEELPSIRKYSIGKQLV